MSITVHGEKSHVADIIRGASTEIVEQEFRLGTFALTDDIEVRAVDNGDMLHVSLLDFALVHETWETAIFLIREGFPFIADLETTDTALRIGESCFSTLGFLIERRTARSVIFALLEYRRTEIDVLKLAVVKYPASINTRRLDAGAYIFYDARPRWPYEKTSWNALEFAIFHTNIPVLHTMFHVQTIPSCVLGNLLEMARHDDTRIHLSRHVIEAFYLEALQREHQAIATVWACKTVPGNVWRDLAEILVPRLLADTFPYRTKIMDTKKRKNPPKKKKLKK